MKITKLSMLAFLILAGCASAPAFRETPSQPSQEIACKELEKSKSLYENARGKSILGPRGATVRDLSRAVEFWRERCV